MKYYYIFGIAVLISIQTVYGYIDPYEYSDDPKLMNSIIKTNALEKLVIYCYDHADRPNPIQDLVDKGLIDSSYQGQDCKTVKSAFDIADQEGAQLMRDSTHWSWNQPECLQGYSMDDGTCIQTDYLECKRDQSKTQKECDLLIGE
jgi:hypothetical protein